MRHVMVVLATCVVACEPAADGGGDATIDAEVDAIVVDAMIVDAEWVGGLRPLPVCTHGDDTGCEGSGYDWCRVGFCCNFYSCLECRGDAHCPPDAPFCRDAECHECLVDADCGPDRPYCLDIFYHSTARRCAQCIRDEDCPEGSSCGGQLSHWGCIEDQ